MERLGLFDDRQSYLSKNAMDTASTQNQSTTFRTKSPIPQSTKTITNSPADLIQLNSSNSIKNKRKNFSPRCSSMVENDQELLINSPSCETIIGEATDLSKKSDLPQFHENEIEKIPQQLSGLINKNNSDGGSGERGCGEGGEGGDGGNVTNKLIHNRSPPPPPPPSHEHQSLDLETMALNWRQLLASHYHLHHHMNQNIGSRTGSEVSSGGNDGNSSRTGNGMEHTESTLYKIPNTNFTITKSSNTLSSGIVDPESKAEFAYNAFTAVQELLNVYGLSISPGDIVEAFKKQQNIGNILQPPTPPRSPITSSTSSSTIPSTSTICENRLNGSFIDQIPSGSRNITNIIKNNNSNGKSIIKNSTTNQSKDLSNVDEITISPASGLSAIESSPPHITIAPVSKLMGLHQQQHHQQHQQHQQQQQYPENNRNDDDDHRSVTTPDDIDDDDGDCDDNDGNNHQNQQQHQQHQQNINSGDFIKDNLSDRDNSPRQLFDLNRINDDSNVSTTEHHSDDQGSDDFCSTNSTNQMDFDTTQSRLSVKNVENLLDKCSLGLFSPLLHLAQMQNEDKQIHAENIKHLTKFSSYLECKNNQCQLENLREHYHCYDLPCFGKVLSKKEEIIRHLKWHKKRNESLNHGFLRFSSTDDCSSTFGPNCTHNRKQTHYHCFQPNCDKVYISTSDVQMHSNYHRKDSAIFQEGFQRYRATEECNADYCMFSGQRTTHFHCRRDNCRFTFKNKADMEKHKSYHIKDLQLARDGFKKFLKTESCPYERCRFSRICNHIHCVRENCYYVLHSSGQLLSHKRKHERMDSEQAYRRFKMIQKAALFGHDLSQLNKNIEPIITTVSSKPSTPSTSSSSAISPDLQQIGSIGHGVHSNSMIPTDLSGSNFSNNIKSGDNTGIKTGTIPVSDLNLFYGGTSGVPIDFLQQMQQRQQQLLRQNSTNIVESINITNEKIQNQITSPQLDHSDNLLMSMISGNSGYNFGETTTSTNIQTPNKNPPSLEDVEQMIRQYFTDNCTRQISTLDLQQQQQQIEPLNLNLKSNSSNNTSGNVKQERGNNSPATTATTTTTTTITTGGNCMSSSGINNTTTTTTTTISSSSSLLTDRIECFLSTNEPHMHCLIKDCEAVIPRSINDITDHMRMHELNRNSEGSNLLQITSIEGFFNRKRGRPPKNRVVEVYNNAQQSPQAIFTSFKLEKTLNEPFPLRSSTTTQSSQVLNPTTILSSDFNQTDINCGIEDRNQNDRKFRIYQPKDKCPDILCLYTNQMHFHCVHDENCKFSTTNGRKIDLHISEVHQNQSGNEIDIYSEFFKHFDSTIDCNVHDCNNRGVKSHFHCTRCGYSITSKSDLQLHICICNPSSIENRRKSGKSSLFNLSTNHPLIGRSTSAPSGILNSSNPMSSGGGGVEQQQQQQQQQQQHIDTPSNSLHYQNIQNTTPIIDNSSGIGGGLTNNERSNIHDDPEIDCTFGVKSESSEEDRVSVVRAAGTYFPENSDTSDHSATLISGAGQMGITSDAIPVCQRPFCKLKRKLHDHCELCNQAFSDRIKLKIHRLKHSSTRLSQIMDVDTINQDISCEQDSIIKTESNPNSSNEQIDQPQDLSLVSQSQLSPINNSGQISTIQSTVSSLLPSNFVDNFSMQNLHLAHLALYQQNPFYYQNFYPFLGSHSLPIGHTDFLKCQFEQQPSTSNNKGHIKHENIQNSFPFVAAAAVAAAAASTSNTTNLTGNDNLRIKRKADDYNSTLDLLPTKKLHKSNKQGNFKIFKDEPVPHGYLKFRFNEDCNFQNCGYRNHQSHFHCRRNDCYYSFCDKTRFVQHTARHERLDKLMGDDFKQYRANMRCGYEDCAYNKNVGQNNKSSHFHCLKCNFICSDTNKVVAHRRQHSKMEFIRMAGFRKVANNEKCTASDHEGSNNECTYSLKQTHYHCLVCDCSVLSRAQLGSHRHRVQ